MDEFGCGMNHNETFGKVVCEDGHGTIWNLNFIQLDTPTLKMVKGKWVTV